MPNEGERGWLSQKEGDFGLMGGRNAKERDEHGFREKRSCETQLVMLVDELAKNIQQNRQTDLVLLDFSKAFDRVSHEKLILKLHQYGVRGQILGWIRAFLSNRSQQVVVDGIKSYSIPVTSRVPQGSVLGPILFLAYINDLPENVTSQVRLFADDTVVYLTIQSDYDAQVLQHNLRKLEAWEALWDMNFNPSKCQVIHVSTSRYPIKSVYTLHGQVLETTSSARYLGVDVSNDLTWKTHIDRISASANKTLGFLKRNIRVNHQQLKSTAYKALVRPQLEYASCVWDPHHKNQIHQIEMVPRRAARWVTRDYSPTSSVTSMLDHLGWRTLEQRRSDARLILFHKIINAAVAIPNSQLIPPARPTRYTHNLSFRQIATNKNVYKYSFLCPRNQRFGGIYENQAKFCQNRVAQAEKHMGLFCETMGSITRKTARLRDKGDILAKQLNEFTKEEDISHSLRAGLQGCSQNLAAVQDYREAQIKRMEAKVVRPLMDYGNICKQLKTDVKNEMNAVKKEIKSKQTLEKVKQKSPQDSHNIAQSEVERARQDASIGSKHLEERMSTFEQRKIHDLKHAMVDFFQIQLVFHAKALEYYTKCLESVTMIDEERDLQEFQRKMSISRGPVSSQEVTQAVSTLTSTNGHSETYASTSATSPYSSTYDSTMSDQRRVRISNTSMMYGDDDDDDYDDEDDDDYDLSTAR
ncbi:hypothetical protein FSP39_018586 [Pinctada imbricata]|uniref:Reverse transcriptase domain-containing protein n=1 Tax=Pinctada imbricata TaxID=66713 RepID=A0AA88XIT4_PINIB|nr:hypothetical protein FSP39_018586 [Pinctada imbricata]